MSVADFQNKRLGKYSDDDSITSITEFTVQKHAARHPVSLGDSPGYDVIVMSLFCCRTLYKEYSVCRRHVLWRETLPLTR